MLVFINRDLTVRISYVKACFFLLSLVTLTNRFGGSWCNKSIKIAKDRIFTQRNVYYTMLCKEKKGQNLLAS